MDGPAYDQPSDHCPVNNSKTIDSSCTSALGATYSSFCSSTKAKHHKGQASQRPSIAKPTRQKPSDDADGCSRAKEDGQNLLEWKHQRPPAREHQGPRVVWMHQRGAVAVLCDPTEVVALVILLQNFCRLKNGPLYSSMGRPGRSFRA